MTMMMPNNEFSSGVATRRELLSWVGSGLGGAALAMLFSRDRLLEAAVVPSEAADPPPHHRPRAKRAIHIFCCGGLSHIDSFDYKPELIKHHGKKLPATSGPMSSSARSACCISRFTSLGSAVKRPLDFRSVPASGWHG